jgi:hypothetical protein
LISGASPVHPPARGDDASAALSMASRTGSPPRTRGRCQGQEAGSRSRRFTPTHAGTMGWSNSAETSNPVHPHARGDDGVNSTGTAADGGSPPRTRGRCLEAYGKRVGTRFTPTHAGTIVKRFMPEEYYAVHPHARGDDDARPSHRDRQDGSPPRTRGRY